MPNPLKRLSLKEIEMEQAQELSQVLHLTEVMSIFGVDRHVVENAINVGALPARRIGGNEFNERGGWLCSRRYAFSIWGHRLKGTENENGNKVEHARQLSIDDLLRGDADGATGKKLHPR